MKKVISVLIASVMTIGLSVSALAVTPVKGESPITISDVKVSGKTITAKYTCAGFDSADDVTFLFYAPQGDAEDIADKEIVDDYIYYADQIDAEGTTGTISFTVDSSLAKGDYALLVGGTDVDIPCLTKVTLDDSVKFGDVTLDSNVNSADLLRLAKFLADFEDEVKAFNDNPLLKNAADVTHDDKVNSADLLKLAKYLADFDGIDLDSTAGN